MDRLAVIGNMLQHIASDKDIKRCIGDRWHCTHIQLQIAVAAFVVGCDVKTG